MSAQGLTNEGDADLQKTGVCNCLEMLILQLRVFVPIWEFAALRQ
jgi:hypothetical protein